MEEVKRNVEKFCGHHSFHFIQKNNDAVSFNVHFALPLKIYVGNFHGHFAFVSKTDVEIFMASFPLYQQTDIGNFHGHFSFYFC